MLFKVPILKPVKMKPLGGDLKGTLQAGRAEAKLAHME